MYTYADGSIWIVNSLYQEFVGIGVTAQVFNLDGTLVYEKSIVVPTLEADSTQGLFFIPSLPNLSSTYFLRLFVLNNTSGAEISNNLYWLSTSPDVLDWSNSTWYNTPCFAYADFQALQTLPNVELEVSFQSDFAPNTTIVYVSNPDNVVAFFIRLRISNGQNGQDVLPINWSDNYFTLMPGESTNVTAIYDPNQLNGEVPIIVAEVWNNISGGQTKSDASAATPLSQAPWAKWLHV